MFLKESFAFFSFSDEGVKEHLSHYLSEARELRPDNGHLLQVCQLFVHCWEVRRVSIPQSHSAFEQLSVRLLIRPLTLPVG